MPCSNHYAYHSLCYHSMIGTAFIHHVHSVSLSSSFSSLNHYLSPLSVSCKNVFKQSSAGFSAGWLCKDHGKSNKSSKSSLTTLSVYGHGLAPASSPVPDQLKKYPFSSKLSKTSCLMAEESDSSSPSIDVSRNEGILIDSVLESKWKLETQTSSSCQPCSSTNHEQQPVLQQPYSMQGIAKRISRYAEARDAMFHFSQWFQGHFDNYDQFKEDQSLGRPPKEGGGHEHIHCHLKLLKTQNNNVISTTNAVTTQSIPQSSKEIPENWFFAKYYFNGDPSFVFRARLYKVIVNEKQFSTLPNGPSIQNQSHAPQLEMRIYRFYEDVEAQLRKENFENVEDFDWSNGENLYEWLEGCEVYWDRLQNNCPEQGAHPGPHFLGYMEGGGCTVFSKQINSDITIEDDLVMTKEDLWVNDRGFDKDGNFIYGNRLGIPYKMKRVHPGGHLEWTVGKN